MLNVGSFLVMPVQRSLTLTFTSTFTFTLTLTHTFTLTLSSPNPDRVRIPRYLLLMRDIHKYTDPNSADFKGLPIAINEIDTELGTRLRASAFMGLRRS